MNESLIENWNSLVDADDTVYHLGDFSFGRKEQVADILSRLNGNKILVIGNHDRSASSMFKLGFDSVYKRLNLALDGYALSLVHDPCKFEEEEEESADLLLCGHVHEHWKFMGPNYVNVGVDQWNYKPVSLATIIGEWNARQA